MTFPTDTLQQNIEITDFKPFLPGENTSSIRIQCFHNLVNQLPLKLKLLHIQRHVLKVKCTEKKTIYNLNAL